MRKNPVPGRQQDTASGFLYRVGLCIFSYLFFAYIMQTKYMFEILKLRANSF